ARIMVEEYKRTKAEERALLRVLELVYKTDDEREFMSVLRKHGIRDEDPRFAEILQFFRALRAGKARRLMRADPCASPSLGQVIAWPRALRGFLRYGEPLRRVASFS